MAYRLGKRAPRFDARTVRLSAPLARALPEIPQVQDWSQNIPYQLWGNDQYGCCAFAAHAALVLTWTAHAQAPIALSVADVLANYGEVTGFNPITGANDNGTVLLDQLRYWAQKGLLRPGQTRDYLTAYGIIDPKDIPGIKRAVAFLGGALAGVMVPEGFMELPLGATWDLNDISEFMCVGGHAIAITGYNEAGIFFNTWGARTFMPWQTFTQIADEAYGIVSRENWTGISGVSPKGERVRELMEEVGKLRSRQTTLLCSSERYGSGTG